MPQLDFTTYSSQIFWFIICFSALYFCASRIILPRIAAIIGARKDIVDKDNSSAQNLEKQIQELSLKTEQLRLKASQEYQSKLSEVIKNATSQREKMIEDLKQKIDQATQKSRQELKSFIEKSNTQSDNAIKGLSQTIKDKFFGKGALSNPSKE